MGKYNLLIFIVAIFVVLGLMFGPLFSLIWAIPVGLVAFVLFLFRKFNSDEKKGIYMKFSKKRMLSSFVLSFFVTYIIGALMSSNSFGAFVESLWFGWMIFGFWFGWVILILSSVVLYYVLSLFEKSKSRNKNSVTRA